MEEMLSTTLISSHSSASFICAATESSHYHSLTSSGTGLLIGLLFML